jgi:16S rRNA (cytosine1402-N4)-methyltransferase
VLLDETLRLLAPQPGETVVDCTAGRGGHAVEFARAVGSSGRIVLIDVDQENLAYAAQRVRDETGLAPCAVHASFAALPAVLERDPATRGLRTDVLFADLGFSSSQMDDPNRGFSFAYDGPLDMRLDPTRGVTAADLLRSLPERDLADLVYRYGEEPLSRRIAAKVAAWRRREPIETTAHLARLVLEAYGPRAHRSRTHPATRTFMALRIAVNDELGALESLLDAVRSGARATASGGWLRPGARVGIVSFHSLEDRLVKHAFVEMAREGIATIRTGKPVVSSKQESAANPRARSAKLRVAMVGGGDGDGFGTRWRDDRGE